MALPDIAILNPLSQLGGAEISLVELLTRCQKRFRFHLILPGNGPLNKVAEQKGIEVRTIRWPESLMTLGERNKKVKLFRMVQSGFMICRFAFKLSQVLRDINVQLLITNGIKCHIIGLIASSINKIPVIWYLREGLEDRKISSKVLRVLSRYCDSVIAVSKYVADNALKCLSKSTSMHVLYNIIDFDKFRMGVAPPKDLIKNNGEIWFGMIGAVTPLKGQDLFLDAAIRVIQVLPNARFFIVGTNFYQTETTFDYEKELRIKACSASLRGNVRFLGFRDDIPAVLSCLDVLVQPNRGPEGLGRSLLEAMACGVPVISVDRWGPSEVIENNKTGLFFQYMNIEDLTEKIILLGTHEKMRKEISDCAYKWVHRNISSDYIGKKFSEILTKVLAVNQQQ